MVHMLDQRVILQVLQHLLGVLHMALHTQGQGLYALKQQECVKGRDCSAGIAQQNRADISGERSRAGSLHKADAVVAGVGFGELRELAALFPIELAAVYDHAAQGGAVTADELGGAVDHNVYAVLNGAQQIGRCKGAVRHQRNAVLVGDLGQGLNVHQVRIGVAQGLKKDQLGVVLNGVLKILQIVRVNKSRLDPVLREGVLQVVVSAAVNGLGADNMVTGLGQCLEGVSQSSRTAGGSQTGYAAL